MQGMESTDHRLRVLVLTSTFPRWTDDTEPAFVFSLCERLSHRFSICVLAPHAPGSKLREQMTNGIDVVRFRYFFDWGESLAYQGGITAKLRSNRLRYFLVVPFLIGQWVALAHLLLRHKFDVVHAHWLFPQGFVAGITKFVLPRFPALVCTSHGTDINGLQSGFFSLIKRFTIRHSDAYTVVSRDLLSKAMALGATCKRTSVISMGVDARELFTPDLNVPRATRQILFVGRLDVQKGIELLIRAMPSILDAYSDCTLRIVGVGPRLEALNEQVMALGMSRCIEFVGAVPNSQLPNYYRSATLVVFPSIEAEGLGLVCAEALACECPVVASNLPAVLEVVQHEVSGLVFQQNDCEDLVSKVLLMLSDPIWRKSMGTAGRKHVLAQYDWHQIEADFERIFMRAIQHG
jgi:glycosyltransferase involved in cell wall biosynthesis